MKIRVLLPVSMFIFAVACGISSQELSTASSVGLDAKLESARGVLGANAYGELTVGGKHIHPAHGRACNLEIAFLQQSGAVGTAVFTNLRPDQGYHGLVYSTTASTTCEITLGGELLKVKKQSDVINAPPSFVQGFVFKSRYPHLQGDDTWESRLLAWPKITDQEAIKRITRNIDRRGFVKLTLTNMVLSYVVGYTADIVDAAPYR